MYCGKTICISFSGIRIRFRFPTSVELTEELSAFLCEDTGSVEAEYEVQLLSEPLSCFPTPFARHWDALIYRTEEGWLRVFTPLIEPDGCQVACLIRPDGRNVLYYPAKRWDFYSAPLRCVHLIAGEQTLLRADAMLLHSSVVCFHGRAVLFSGPSGAGKSTQARLWERNLGAEVINGDRALIRKQDGGFVCGGSPWAGTSGIYRRESAPLAGIFLVEQASENRTERLGFRALAPLLSQTVVNSWDLHFMERLTGLYQELLSFVPVYRLYCRPDEGAVQAACRALLETGRWEKEERR